MVQVINASATSAATISWCRAATTARPLRMLAPLPSPRVTRGYHGNQGDRTADSMMSELEIHHSRQTASTPIVTTTTRPTHPSLLAGCQTQPSLLDHICECEHSRAHTAGLWSWSQCLGLETYQRLVSKKTVNISVSSRAQDQFLAKLCRSQYAV